MIDKPKENSGDKRNKITDSVKRNVNNRLRK